MEIRGYRPLLWGRIWLAASRGQNTPAGWWRFPGMRTNPQTQPRAVLLSYNVITLIWTNTAVSRYINASVFLFVFWLWACYSTENDLTCIRPRPPHSWAFPGSNKVVGVTMETFPDEINSVSVYSNVMSLKKLSCQQRQAALACVQLEKWQINTYCFFFCSTDGHFYTKHSNNGWNPAGITLQKVTDINRRVCLLFNWQVILLKTDTSVYFSFIHSDLFVFLSAFHWQRSWTRWSG